jgi:hypothetical protein
MWVASCATWVGVTCRIISLVVCPKLQVSSVLPQNNENRVDFFTNHPVMFLFFPNVDGGDVSD